MVPSAVACTKIAVSITSLVPFPYLRLRKKLGFSYSAILEKVAGNRNFCAKGLW